jgi:hypothetical protein
MPFKSEERQASFRVGDNADGRTPEHAINSLSRQVADIARHVARQPGPTAPVPSAIFMFPVQLTNDGGTDGITASSTKALWTYTVKDWGGVFTLGTKVSPLFPRLFACPTVKATQGWGFIDHDGVFQLMACDETYGQSNCT